jgi:hypothetical protein
MTDQTLLFVLRLKPYTRKKRIEIKAWDRPDPADNPTGHSYIDVEVKHGAAVIFPRGQLYCGVNQWTATDGEAAKALVLSLVAMKPGDTDEDYFEGYSDDQKAWANEYGDVISMTASYRYGEQ